MTKYHWIIADYEYNTLEVSLGTFEFIINEIISGYGVSEAEAVKILKEGDWVREWEKHLFISVNDE
mgnify:CR=1 FL=1